MLGLAVLFFLGLWIIITIAAMVIGSKFGRFIVYWTIEYYQIQRTVTHLCETEGGIKVYITPEEWRKQIGEEEWESLHEDWKNIDHNLKFKFNGKNYYGSTQLNRRVISYEAKDKRKDIIRDSDYIYVDKNTNQVLFRNHYFSVGMPAIANSLSGLKFWLNDVNDCNIGEWSYDDRFFSRKYTNYQLTKGE